jgi:hypothetical protein
MYQIHAYYFLHLGREEVPYFQARACYDFVHGRLNVVDEDRSVVLEVGKDSIVRIVGQGRHTAVAASCIAVAAIERPKPVAEPAELLSVVEGHIVPLSLADDTSDRLRIKGVYSLGLLRWAI